ncbi:hypothetical protein Plhal304r1_c029g0094561 [Plasmopara halstedii]
MWVVLAPKPRAYHVCQLQIVCVSVTSRVTIHPVYYLWLNQQQPPQLVLFMIRYCNMMTAPTLICLYLIVSGGLDFSCQIKEVTSAQKLALNPIPIYGEFIHARTFGLTYTAADKHQLGTRLVFIALHEIAVYPKDVMAHYVLNGMQ